MSLLALFIMIQCRNESGERAAAQKTSVRICSYRIKESCENGGKEAGKGKMLKGLFTDFT